MAESFFEKRRELVLIVSAAFIVIIVTILVFFIIQFLNNPEKGIKNPDNFKSYENEFFSLAYPENWKFNDTGYPPLLSITSNESKPELNQTTFVTITRGQESALSNKDKDTIKSVLDGNCKDLKSYIRESLSLRDDRIIIKNSQKIFIDTIETCSYDIEQTNLTSKIVTKGKIYLIADKYVEDLYLAIAISNKENQSDLEDALKVPLTLRLKSKEEFQKD